MIRYKYNQEHTIVIDKIDMRHTIANVQAAKNKYHYLLIGHDKDNLSGYATSFSTQKYDSEYEAFQHARQIIDGPDFEDGEW